MPRILHIEDDPANRLLVRKLLTPAGFDVIDAADGLEGIRLACASPPDLVLVDIAIPGLDGYEVTLRLRAEPALKDVPIVAITAEGSRETSLAVGCDGFLQKPIDARAFARTIGGYLGGLKEEAPRSSEHLRRQSQRIVGHLEEQIAQVSEANQRLVELDQARREFYRNVSHELATPMTPIVGYVRLLSDGELGPLNDAQKKALNAVDECAQRLRGLIDNLLDVTSLETGRMRFINKEYDLAVLVDRVLGREKSALEQAGLELRTDFPDGPLSGIGDPERLTRAVQQLVENAVKFTPAGGTVGVRVRAVGDAFEVLVADTGPGVSESAQARVFEPFFQADGSVTRSHGGAGVGLAVVSGVAKGHGGKVTLTSPGNEKFGATRLTGACFAMRVARNARVLGDSE